MRKTLAFGNLHGAILVFCFVLAAAGARAGDWEKEIRAFEAQDKTDPPPQGAILFLGSSSIRLWQSLAEDFPEQKVINRGFGGSQIADSIRYAERIVLPHKPRQIVVYAGDNDLAGGKTPETVSSDFQALARKIHETLPETRLVYISIKPSIARWHLADRIRAANDLIREFCRKDRRLAFIDVFDPMLGPDGKPKGELLIADGLHLNRKGYELWRDLVKPHLGKAE